MNLETATFIFNRINGVHIIKNYEPNTGGVTPYAIGCSRGSGIRVLGELAQIILVSPNKPDFDPKVNLTNLTVTNESGYKEVFY